MAQIPLGNFDLPSAVPRTQPSRVDNSGALAAGRAIEQAGQTGMQVSGQLLARQAAERRAAEQQDEALARAKAANAVAEQRLQVQAATANIEDQLRRGADYKQASTMYDEAVGKIEIPTIEGLPPEAAEMYQGGISQARMAGRLSLDNMVVSARRDAGQQQFAQLLDTLGKQAGMPGADVAAVNATAQAALPLFREFGLDGSTLDKAVQEFADKNWSNQALQRYNAGNDDLVALKALQEDLTAEDGAYMGLLDSDKRNAISFRVGERIDALERKTAAAADKSAAAAERALDQMDAQLSTGVPPTAEQVEAWAGIIKAAPQYRDDFAARQQMALEVQQLLRMPIDDQKQAIAEKQAALYSQGGDAKDIANFERMRTAVDANVKMLQENPLQYAAARMGEKVEPLPLAALVDPAQAGALTAALEHRATVIGALRRQMGPQVQDKPLLPQEVGLVVAGLEKLPPERQVETYGQLRRMAGSDATYTAIMGQIADGAPVKSMAGMLQLRNPKAARLVIMGDALLNGEKGSAPKMPSADEFDTELADALGSAFRGRPGALAVARQAVRAAYAGAVASDGDTSGEFDDQRLRDVVRAVLGDTVDFNGRGEVFVPYGSDPDQFEDRVDAAWATQRDQVQDGMPLDLGRYGLQQKGDGTYFLKAGRDYVYGKDGNRFVLDIRRPPVKAKPAGDAATAPATGVFGAF